MSQKTKQEIREALNLFNELIEKLSKISDSCEELGLARIINLKCLLKLSDAKKKLNHWYNDNY